MDINKRGFTLAEVLITLVVIGVIAAITVPVVMNNVNEKGYRSGLVKTVAALNQAISSNYAKTGMTVSDYSVNLLQGTDKPDIIKELFAKEMKVINPEGVYWCSDENVDPDPSLPENCEPLDENAFVTLDGVVYGVGEIYTENGSCDFENKVPCLNLADGEHMMIDVNGNKGPNQVTKDAKHPKDQYYLLIFNQKIVPHGDAAQQIMYEATKK